MLKQNTEIKYYIDHRSMPSISAAGATTLVSVVELIDEELSVDISLSLILAAYSTYIAQFSSSHNY
jgi:hypothetical protein